MRQSVVTYGGIGGIIAGFAFWPTLDDNFWKFLVVAIPTTISVVSSLFGSWAKLSEALVKQIASMLEAKLASAADTEIERIKAAIAEERENFTKTVVDEVWYRIDTINKLTDKTDEKVFDVQELSAK